MLVLFTGVLSCLVGTCFLPGFLSPVSFCLDTLVVSLPFDLPILTFGMSGGPPFRDCALGMVPTFLCDFGSSRAWALSVRFWIALSCLSG